MTGGPSGFEFRGMVRVEAHFNSHPTLQYR
jgi:hypothetical protein